MTAMALSIIAVGSSIQSCKNPSAKIDTTACEYSSLKIDITDIRNAGKYTYVYYNVSNTCDERVNSIVVYIELTCVDGRVFTNNTIILDLPGKTSLSEMMMINTVDRRLCNEAKVAHYEFRLSR